jgi:hypothetical protein
VKIMKKVLIFLLVIGVLMIGTFAVAEEFPESLDEISNSLESDPEEPNEEPIPCGGGGSGGGPGGLPG